MVWTVATAVVGVLALDLLVRLFFARIILGVFETRPPFNVESCDVDVPAERISFPGTHGLTLRGSLYRHFDRPSRGLVLFCPELDGNHHSAMWYCGGLWNAGFDILSFDFRNQGESDHMPGYVPMHWLSGYEVSDVRAALEYVRSHPDLRHLPLSVHGVSRGAGAALVATATAPAVRCVSCDGAYSTDSLMLYFTLRWATLYVPPWLVRLLPGWHIQGTLRLVRRLSQWRKGCHYVVLERYLARLGRRPTLLIAGERDSYVPPSISRTLCCRIGSGCEELWVVPQAKHNMARHVDPDGYDHRLVEFHDRPGRDDSQAAAEPVAAARYALKSH